MESHFIPLIMGFSCNVPAVMATRTIESRRSRLITMLILPLMSCSARLPIYVMITGSFFALKYRSLAMLSLYIVGVLMAVAMSRLFSAFVVKGEDTPFVMELPPYRFPTWKAIGRHTWEKGKQYLKKDGRYYPCCFYHRMGFRLLPSSDDRTWIIKHDRNKAISDESVKPLSQCSVHRVSIGNGCWLVVWYGCKRDCCINNGRTLF